MANKIKIGLGGDATGTNETGANAVTNGSPRNIQPATVDRPVTVDRVVVSTPAESIAVAPSKDIPIKAAEAKPSVPVINAKETAPTPVTTPTSTPTKKIAGDTGLNQTNTDKSTDYEVKKTNSPPPVTTTTTTTPKKDDPPVTTTPKNEDKQPEKPKNDETPKTNDRPSSSSTSVTTEEKKEPKKPRIQTTDDKDKTTVDKTTDEEKKPPKKDDIPDEPDRDITTTTTTITTEPPKPKNNHAQHQAMSVAKDTITNGMQDGVSVHGFASIATNAPDGSSVNKQGVAAGYKKTTDSGVSFTGVAAVSTDGDIATNARIGKSLKDDKTNIFGEVGTTHINKGQDNEVKKSVDVALGAQRDLGKGFSLTGAIQHAQMKTFGGEKASATGVHVGTNYQREIADGRAILSAGLGANFDVATKNVEKSNAVALSLGVGTNNKTAQDLIVREEFANVKPVVEQVQKQTYSLNLNTDAMFAFNKGDAANLKPGAKMEVSKFVDTLLAPNATTDGKSIWETMKEKGLPLEIVGRTDKFGENEAKYKNGKMVFQGNYALSDERANTTSQLIIAEFKRRTGEDITSMVRARGVGENEATVDEKMAIEQAKQRLGVNKETPAVKELARQYTQVDRNATSNLIGVDNIRPEFAQEKGLQVQVKTHTEQITKQVEVKEDHYYKLEGKRISSDPEKLKAQIAEGKVRVQEINPTEDEKMAAKASPINFTAMQSTNEAAKQAQEIEKQKVEQEQTLKNTSAFKPQ